MRWFWNRGRPESIVRRTAEERHEQRMKSGGSPGEMLADITLFAIAHFPDPGSASDGQQEKALDINAIIQRHFSGDATLFEVACYVLFRIDLWHFENDFCELREEMGDYLAERFAAVFRQALPKVGVEVLMEHRLREYAALVRADDPAPVFHGTPEPHPRQRPAPSLDVHRTQGVNSGPGCLPEDGT